MTTNRRFVVKLFCISPLLYIYTSKLIASESNVFSTLSLVQKDLFPHIKELNIDSFSYLKLILSHSKVSKKIKDNLINGAIYLNDESKSLYNKDYIDLNSDLRDKVISAISKTLWGENWIYNMLGFIMESILGDPIYNINNNESGWKWLNHHTGLPQPKKAFL